MKKESHEEFEIRMAKTYPLLYEDMYGNPMDTIMAFGMEIDSGWHDLVEELSGNLEKCIKPIYNSEYANPNAFCARCGKGRKWHWFFYIINLIKYFFMNKLFVMKAMFYEVKRARKFKTPVLRRLRSILGIKRYRACESFRISHPRALQVKTKYGGLRFYMTHGTDEIFELIDEAEDKSYEICELCGEKGKPRDIGWIWTLCDKCHKKKGGVV